MRRTRRHKFLQISVFFLVYSIIHALSDKEANKTLETTTGNVNKSGPSKSTTTTTITPPKALTEKAKNITKELRIIETITNLNESGNCTPPAIEQASTFFNLIALFKLFFSSFRDL